MTAATTELPSNSSDAGAPPTRERKRPRDTELEHDALRDDSNGSCALKHARTAAVDNDDDAAQSYSAAAAAPSMTGTSCVVLAMLSTTKKAAHSRMQQ